MQKVQEVQEVPKGSPGHDTAPYNPRPCAPGRRPRRLWRNRAPCVGTTQDVPGQALRFLGYVRMAREGTRRIRESMKEWGLPEPVLSKKRYMVS
jgi:hypothetical protein